MFIITVCSPAFITFNVHLVSLCVVCFTHDCGVSKLTHSGIQYS